MADKVEIPLRCSWIVGTRRAHGYLIVEKDLLRGGEVEIHGAPSGRFPR